MTATNHAITGAVVGLALGNPYLALPISLMSHYAMDTLPHFGGKWPIKSRAFLNYLIIEALLCFVIVLTLFLSKPHHYLLAMICAFVAASPDFFSFKYFKTLRADKKYIPGRYFRFAKGIQKKESPNNLKYDIAWFFVMLILFMFLIKHN